MLAQTFSSEQKPEGARTRAFQTTLAELFSVDLSVSTVDDKPFASEVLAYRSPRLHVALLGFSAHRTSFAGASRGRARGANLLVSVHREGEVEVSQGERATRIRPGDIFLIDPARPFEIETGAMQTYSIYLPRAAMRELTPHLDGLTATAIPGGFGAGAAFCRLFEEVFQLAPQLPEEAADRIAEAFPPLLAAAMMSIPAGEDALPSQMKLFQRQRVRRFVRDNLHDPELDPDQIARGVNLSARYLHALFTDQPLTLMRWVWAERLERCRSELRQPALNGRSVGEIAYGWGFSDLAHFSRAFKERFGQSPRRYRSASAE